MARSSWLPQTFLRLFGPGVRLAGPIDRPSEPRTVGDLDEVMTCHAKPNLSTAMLPLCCKLVSEAGIPSL